MTINLPESWSQKELKDIAVIERKNVKPEDISGDTIFIGLEHINSSGEFTSIETVQAGQISSNKFSFNSKHILYGKLRPYLRKITRPEFNGICSTDILPILPCPEINRDYLYHYLRQQEYVDLATTRSSGANLPRISPKTLETFTVSFPPLEEQKRIAAILDKADRVRRKRQEAIRLTEELGRSIFLDMFGDPISQGWKMVKVGDMAAKSKNSMRTGPFGSNLLHSEFVDEGIPVLGIDNAVKNRFLWAKPRFITPEKYKQLKNYTVYPEDVIITIMGTCGRCAIIPDDCSTAINTKHLCCITTNKEVCLPEFLYGYFLFHPIAKQYFERNTKGAIMDGLNQTIIKGLPIPLAPMRLQHQYKKAIQKLNVIELKAKNHFSSSENLFNSLLQRAFRGEL